MSYAVDQACCDLGILVAGCLLSGVGIVYECRLQARETLEQESAMSALLTNTTRGWWGRISNFGRTLEPFSYLQNANTQVLPAALLLFSVRRNIQPA